MNLVEVAKTALASRDFAAGCNELIDAAGAYGGDFISAKQAGDPLPPNSPEETAIGRVVGRGIPFPVWSQIASEGMAFVKEMIETGDFSMVISLRWEIKMKEELKMSKSLMLLALVFASSMAWADEAKVSSAPLPKTINLAPKSFEFAKPKKESDPYLGFKPETDPNKLAINGAPTDPNEHRMRAWSEANRLTREHLSQKAKNDAIRANQQAVQQFQQRVFQGR